MLAEHLKIVKLQQEGERERTIEAVKLFKAQQECEKERTAEQVKLLKLQQEAKHLEIVLIKQLKKAEDSRREKGRLHVTEISTNFTHEECVRKNKRNTL